MLLLCLSTITSLKQLCLLSAHSWQTRYSLCTSQPKLSCSWTGLNSLTQNTWAHYRRRQPSPTHNIQKRPLHALIIYIKWIYMIIFINSIWKIIFNWNNNNNFRTWHFYSCLVVLTTIVTKSIKKIKNKK